MSDERDRREALAFERYWDALASGRTAHPSGELDPAAIAAAKRLRALGNGPAVDPARAASVWEEIMHAHALQPDVRSQPAGPISANGRVRPLVSPTPPRPTVLRPARPHRQRWWERGAALIGVAALIVAMIGGIFFAYRNPRGNELPAVVASPTANAVATPATPAAASPALPPDATVGGLSLADWTIRAVQWNMSFPMAVNPWSDTTGERCGYGQSGPVFFLGVPPGELDQSAPASATRSCTVPAGVALFVPVAFNECDNLSSPPFFGADEAAQRACAAGNIDVYQQQIVAAGVVIVDGVNVDLTPYRVSTPQFTLILPPGNVNGAPAGVASAVDDGYQLLLAPLTPGTHVVTIHVPHPGRMNIVTYNLTVAPPLSAAPAATPAA